MTDATGTWIPIARPIIGDAEKVAVVEVLESARLIQGATVERFEQAFAELHGARFGVATSSGTTALIAALMAHAIGAGDEVIVPAFSFFATASCLLAVGAVPVFADIDPVTFCLDPEAAERAITPRTKAILPVHLYGQPANMPAFASLCARRGLVLLEDAAQAHGAAIESRHVGTWGTAAFSFHASKNMTTGEGGMVLTNDAAVAARARLARQQGMRAPHEHVAVGFNFRMTELAAALGLIQLGQLSAWNRRRAENARRYQDTLRHVIPPKSTPGYTSSHHQYTVRVPLPLDRDRLVEKLREAGVDARVFYAKAIYEQPVLASRPEYARLALPETARATREVMSLPVHPGVTDEQIGYIADAIARSVVGGAA